MLRGEVLYCMQGFHRQKVKAVSWHRHGERHRPWGVQERWRCGTEVWWAGVGLGDLKISNLNDPTCLWSTGVSGEGAREGGWGPREGSGIPVLEAVG